MSNNTMSGLEARTASSPSAGAAACASSSMRTVTCASVAPDLRQSAKFDDKALGRTANLCGQNVHTGSQAWGAVNLALPNREHAPALRPQCSDLAVVTVSVAGDLWRPEIDV